jgi:hypothetical protein
VTCTENRKGSTRQTFSSVKFSRPVASSIRRAQPAAPFRARTNAPGPGAPLILADTQAPPATSTEASVSDAEPPEGRSRDVRAGRRGRPRADGVGVATVTRIGRSLSPHIPRGVRACRGGHSAGAPPTPIRAAAHGDLRVHALLGLRHLSWRRSAPATPRAGRPLDRSWLWAGPALLPRHPEPSRAIVGSVVGSRSPAR